jgi:hypothetical protein
MTDNQIFAAYLAQPDFARFMLESGCTTHISNSRGNYNSIEVSTHAIKVADGRVLLSGGSGSIGCIPGVEFYKDVTMNILSLHQFEANGYTMDTTTFPTITLSHPTAIHPPLVFHKEGKFWFTDIPLVDACTHMSDAPILDHVKVLHRRMLHSYVPNLATAAAKGTITGISFSKEDKKRINALSPGYHCDDCVKAKQSEQPLSGSGNIQATRPGQIVYFDIKGLPVQSNHRKHYYILFVDAYSDTLYFYFLTHKGDALEKGIKAFETQVCIPSGWDSVRLVCDNAKEFKDQRAY